MKFHASFLVGLSSLLLVNCSQTPSQPSNQRSLAVSSIESSHKSLMTNPISPQGPSFEELVGIAPTNPIVDILPQPLRIAQALTPTGNQIYDNTRFIHTYLMNTHDCSLISPTNQIIECHGVLTLENQWYDLFARQLYNGSKPSLTIIANLGIATQTPLKSIIFYDDNTDGILDNTTNSPHYKEGMLKEPDIRRYSSLLRGIRNILEKQRQIDPLEQTR